MFRISYLALALVFVLAIKTTDSRKPQKITVSVYYESQCPDSKDFVVQQLQPALQLLHEHINLELIPFGKSRSLNNDTFECQHGPTECLGNMVQGCTINLMEGRATDIQIAKYVACELESEAGTKKDMRCVNKAGANVDMVEKCISSNEGISQQLKYERMTNEVKPEYIPTVIFNRHFDQETHDSAIEDLTGTLCSHLKDVKPCSHHYNKIAMEGVLQS